MTIKVVYYDWNLSHLKEKKNEELKKKKKSSYQ